MLPGGDNSSISDLLGDGSNLGADLGSWGAGSSRGAGCRGDVRNSYSRLALRGTRVGRKPEEMKSQCEVLGMGALDQFRGSCWTVVMTMDDIRAFE